MISAKEARELSGPDSSEYLKHIEFAIRRACKAKKKEVVIRDNPYARWLYDRSKISPEAEKTLKTLEDSGYKISLYYKEMQFVDMGLKIKW